MAVSQNGWVANDRSRVTQWTIPGTVRRITLEKGAAGYLLTHFSAWFDKNVEDIEAGQLDDWGYAERPIRGGSELSNHASGTAIDLNAPEHPLAAVDTFTPGQASAIRRQLAVYEGTIRWGGDYTGRKDEMHFEINAGLAAVTRVANKLRAKDVDDMPLNDADKKWILKAIQDNVGWARNQIMTVLGYPWDMPPAKPDPNNRFARAVDLAFVRDQVADALGFDHARNPSRDYTPEHLAAQAPLRKADIPAIVDAVVAQMKESTK